jgi:diguanylate cyclase (GGDEF)-like protein
LRWPLRLSAVVAGVVLVAWVWRAGLANLPPGAAWLLIQFPLAICVVSLAYRFASRHERQWIRPSLELTRLIEEVRGGDTPIESLSAVSGPIAPLARSVQELLHDLRRERQAKARMQLEANQRVRQSTDALQRKINSWQTQAYRDALTGLYNRRLLDEQLPKMLEQCAAGQTPLCVVGIDLDHFKKVNDTLGHAAGDRLLRDIGQLIRSAVREKDMAFRVGGDEFLILLPDHDARAGLQLSQRLGAMVDQLAVTVRSEPRPGLSMGVVCLTQFRGIKPADVIHMADEAMYQDKAARKARR